MFYVKQYEFIVTYFDILTYKEQCCRFDDARTALNYICTLGTDIVGNLHCFGSVINSSFVFDLCKDNWYMDLLEKVIDFQSYNLGEFN